MCRVKRKISHKTRVSGIPDDLFDAVVFIFPKDRIENWVEFLQTGYTDEDLEGPRIDPAVAAGAAKKLAGICRGNDGDGVTFPPSLLWSCQNWKHLVERMR